MNHKIFVILAFIAVVFGCASPGIIVQNFEAEQIVHSSQIKTTDNIADYVFFLDKGDTLPLKFVLENDILSAPDGEINLILKQKIYFRLKMPEALNSDNLPSMSDEEKRKHLNEVEIFLSPDATRWAPSTDIKAIEHVFGIKGGFFSVGPGITKEEGIKIFVSVRTNRM